MNLGTAKQKALQLIREYSNNGSIIGTGDNADYLLSMNNLADIAQKEIATYKKIQDQYTFSHMPIPVQNATNEGFDVIQKLDEDFIFQQTGSKAYYFEVDNIATIYIEEFNNGSWNALSTISNSIKNEFTAYKGLITPTVSTNLIRLRFSGDYVYSIRNYALYKYAFPTVDDVQEYSPYLRYDMPSNFMELKEIMFETNNKQYMPLTNCFWENKNLLIAYDLKGQIIIDYFKYPDTITSDSLDSMQFEVDTDAQELIPLYIAARVLIDENPSISTNLLNEYQLKLSRLHDNILPSNTSITNTYTM